MIHFNKVVIIGTGLIGGSIGINLVKKGLAGEVLGIGRTAENLKLAKDKGALTDWRRISAPGGIRGQVLKGADLVILATPVSDFESYLKIIAEECIKDQSDRRHLIVTDVGSTKASVVEKAERILPLWTDFVGAHPIAGSEKSGSAAADENLFKDRPCILTPTRKTNREALRKVEELWKEIGAKVFNMSAEKHDSSLSAISHLPHIIAFVLMNAVYECVDDHKIITGLNTTSLKEMTRLAGSSPDMWAAISFENQNHVLRALDLFQNELGFLKENLKKRSWGGLKKFYGQARKRRNIIFHSE